MWDVNWMDPFRETVDERRSRKNANATSSKQPESPSRRSSILSFNSNEHQIRKPSFINFLGGSSLPSKKRTKSPKEGRLLLESLPTDQDEKLSEAAKWVNQLYEVPPDNPQTALELSPYSLSSQSIVRCNYDTEHSSASDAAESIFSGWTGKTENTQSTWSTGPVSKSPNKKAPPLSLNSVLSKKKEPAFIPLECPKSFERTMSALIGIDPPKESSRSRKRTSASTSHGKVEKTALNLKASGGIKVTKTETRDICHIKLPQDAEEATAEWRPPDAWECMSPNEIKTREKKDIYRFEGQMPKFRLDGQIVVRVPEIFYRQREIRMMEAATSKIVLERLQEEWNVVADASIYRELELKKQLWMLRALRGFNKKMTKDPMKIIVENRKVMSLYENDALASTMSALTTAKEVYHVAVTPLSQSDYPNIIPRNIASPSTQISYPVNTFMSISAVSMPYLFPASSIPTLLKECHRVLVSPVLPPSPTLPAEFDSSPRTTQQTRGGSLHLIILDPSPIEATIGPHFRNWLETHLMINLERHFRCVHPSRIFPVWLEDAGLQAKSSKNFHVRFLASVPKNSQSSAVLRNEKLESDELEESDSIELQLKSVAGRMLWKYMWGNFVLGEKWWWEDKEIIEECEKLGTSWEYNEIEAVKGG
ncbi:hypothetical protein HI914_05316 [Erysiphe necator]|uniref:Uncharacterized protein n=1 Tax=Uncinula necator TaxID=52586 RepID=A0A0B1PG26_UNCNE|nr:hypothetical protein HI914_05316 [Erysiphe necator]KHJ35801.1 hypothetical protein EV44_g1291 [Erysiphe necator]